MEQEMLKTIRIPFLESHVIFINSLTCAGFICWRFRVHRDGMGTNIADGVDWSQEVDGRCWFLGTRVARSGW